MSLEDHGNSWTYGKCESCLKNAGDSIHMVCENIDNNFVCFVCPQCGSTKRL